MGVIMNCLTHWPDILLLNYVWHNSWPECSIKEQFGGYFPFPLWFRSYGPHASVLTDLYGGLLDQTTMEIICKWEKWKMYTCKMVWINNVESWILIPKHVGVDMFTSLRGSWFILLFMYGETPPPFLSVSLQIMMSIIRQQIWPVN